MKTKKGFPKRYIILFSLIAAILLGSLAYILATGSTFTVRELIGTDPPDMSKCEITVDDPGVIRIVSTDVEADNEFYYVVVKTEAVTSGNTRLHFRYTLDKSTMYESEANLIVSPLFHFVYDTQRESFTGEWILYPTMLLLVSLTLGFFLFSFIEQLRKAQYSYSTVALGGVIIFLAISLIIWISEFFLYGFSTMSTFYGLRLNMAFLGSMFASLTFPVLLVLSIAVSISNIVLVFKEGLRPMNLLGIILGIAVVGGFFALHYFANDFSFAGEEGSSEWISYQLQSTVLTALYVVFSYFECMLLSTIICAILATRHKVPYDRDYLIILGCAIRKDGTPTPILKGRIDRAIEFEQNQYAATGKHAYFIPSGGQGSDEVISEAECMKRYLLSYGVSEERIVKEDKSVNTYQNMAFSNQVIKGHSGGKDVNIAFSTTNYHVFRGYTLAKTIGMVAQGLSAKTKLYFYPNAFVREFIGLLYEQRYRHIVAMVILANVFAFMMLTIFY